MKSSVGSYWEFRNFTVNNIDNLCRFTSSQHIQFVVYTWVKPPIFFFVSFYFLVVRAPNQDVSWSPSNWDMAPRSAQDALVRLCLSIILGTARGHPGWAGGSSGGQRCLGLSTLHFASITLRGMDGMFKQRTACVHHRMYDFFFFVAFYFTVKLDFMRKREEKTQTHDNKV